jgi:hypothetical protein
LEESEAGLHHLALSTGVFQGILGGLSRVTGFDKRFDDIAVLDAFSRVL